MVTRESMLELHSHMSRRGLFKRTVQAAGIALFWDKFVSQASAQTSAATTATDPIAVLSAMGNVIVPIDQDPGWASWDPAITKYAWNSFVPQVLLGGNAILQPSVTLAVQYFNTLPQTVGYSIYPFLSMNLAAQTQYYGDVLEGGFQDYGTQDVMFVAAFIGLFACKGVFYSNYPNHLAVPGAEFQAPFPATPIPTAWTSIGYKGPVSQAEEATLRAKSAGVTVIPGVDPNNPYL
jgi:hypothetical protein